MVNPPSQRGTGRKPVAWIRPLGFLATIRGAPAFRSSVAAEMLRKTGNTCSMKTRAGGKIDAEVPFLCCRGTGASRIMWELCNSPEIDGESIEDSESTDDVNFPGGPSIYD